MSSSRARAAEAKGEHGLLLCVYHVGGTLRDGELGRIRATVESAQKKRQSRAVKCWRGRARLGKSGEQREKMRAEGGQEHEGDLMAWGGFLGGCDGGQDGSLLARWLRTL